MTLAAIQSGCVGMALFDIWDACVKKSLKAKQKCHGDPLVAAAGEAFERYIQAQEIGFAAQIAGVACYALQPRGDCVKPITQDQIAPFLALNILA